MTFDLVDTVTGVTIMPPIQLNNGELPAGIPLLFSSAVNTRFGTAITSELSYSWDFGNGKSSSGASTSYTYPSGGRYTVALTVRGTGGTASSSLPLSVFEGSNEFSQCLQYSELFPASLCFLGHI